MHADDIRELLEAKPFLPFRINLPSLLEHYVDDPTRAELSSSGEVLIIRRPDGGRHLITLRQIVDIIVSRPRR